MCKGGGCSGACGVGMKAFLLAGSVAGVVGVPATIGQGHQVRHNAPGRRGCGARPPVLRPVLSAARPPVLRPVLRAAC
jgi:hypothetical protein